MAPDQGSALSADLQRVFERQIRPDLLDAVSPATSPPAAFLIDGAPGAGVATTMAQLRRQMGPSVGISVDTLRQYHRPLRTPGTQRTADTEQADVARWYAHLIAETMRKRCNLIVDLSLAKGPATTALADSMKRASYDVTAVVLATGRDQNRQAALAAYDLCQCSGLAVRLDPALLRDTGERLVRDTLQRLESTASVDRLQLLDGNGREIYQNHRSASGWAHAPRALAVFDDVALHRPSPEALADSALRWLTLAQRLASNPAVPREVASQALAWRDEAVRLAENDPQAQQRLTCGREAEAFRTLNRHQFLREFPQHAKAAQLLDEAVAYAEREFAQASERERFIQQTRQRVAERLAEGRLAPTRERGERSR
jgi:Zeta toxin